jgi:hypothetical protein
MMARIQTGQEAREAGSKTCIEEMKATDLEANPEEIVAKAEHWRTDLGTRNWSWDTGTHGEGWPRAKLYKDP